MDSLPILLNKLHAMHSAGIVTLAEIGKAIGQREQRVSEWVTQRTHRPRTDAFIKLHEFAAKQTIRIAMSRKIQPVYRSAYKSACDLFPVNGKASEKSVKR